MDSLTQFVLGSAVAEATIGHRVGRLAALTGGIVATLPDLDVFVPLGDPVSDFTYHRSATHSLLLLTLAAPLVAWLITRFKQTWRDDFKPWLLTVWLVLITHPLLDSLTVYGTQLLWPLSEHPFAVGSIFIIDPLYTLPLLGAVITAQLMRRTERRASRLNAWVLVATTAYLALGFGAQQWARSEVVRQAQVAGLGTERVGVWATPFNIAAWRAVIVGPDGYHVGYYSLLGAGKIVFGHYVSRPELLASMQDSPHVARLAWFTKGFYAVAEEAGQVVMRDLRMGLEPDRYVFGFAVASSEAGDVEARKPERVAPEPYSPADWQALRNRVLGQPPDQ